MFSLRNASRFTGKPVDRISKEFSFNDIWVDPQVL